MTWYNAADAGGEYYAQIVPDGVVYNYANGSSRFVPSGYFYYWHSPAKRGVTFAPYPTESKNPLHEWERVQTKLKEHKPMSNTYAQVSEDTNASNPSAKLELRTSSYSSSSVTLAVDSSGANVNGVRLDVRDANSMLDGLRHFVRASERVAKWSQKARDAADLPF